MISRWTMRVDYGCFVQFASFIFDLHNSDVSDSIGRLDRLAGLRGTEIGWTLFGFISCLAPQFGPGERPGIPGARRGIMGGDGGRESTAVQPHHGLPNPRERMAVSALAFQ
ncbi:hypothetical protein JCM30394_07310 [Deferrisoma palaeochoriense]